MGHNQRKAHLDPWGNGEEGVMGAIRFWGYVPSPGQRDLRGQIGGEITQDPEQTAESPPGAEDRTKGTQVLFCMTWGL